MKIILYFMLLLVPYITIAQLELPFYEQIAFDFYKDSIKPNFPVKKRLKISKDVNDLHPAYTHFWVPRCLTGSYLEKGKDLEVFENYVFDQMNFESPIRIMNYEGLSRKEFRIKKRRPNSYPFLNISPPYHKKNNLDEFYVTISEHYYDEIVYCYLLLDEKGHVKNWCREVSIITHTH